MALKKFDGALHNLAVDEVTPLAGGGGAPEALGG